MTTLGSDGRLPTQSPMVTMSDDPSASRVSSRLSYISTRGVEVALRCRGASARTGSDAWCDACVNGSVAGVVAEKVLSDFAGECRDGRGVRTRRSAWDFRRCRCTRSAHQLVARHGGGDGVDAADVVKGASRADPDGGVVADEVSVDGCWESFTWSDGASAIAAVAAAGAEPLMRVECGRR